MDKRLINEDESGVRPHYLKGGGESGSCLILVAPLVVVLGLALVTGSVLWWTAVLWFGVGALMIGLRKGY